VQDKGGRKGKRKEKSEGKRRKAREGYAHRERTISSQEIGVTGLHGFIGRKRPRYKPKLSRGGKGAKGIKIDQLQSKKIKGKKSSSDWSAPVVHLGVPLAR